MTKLLYLSLILLFGICKLNAQFFENESSYWSLNYGLADVFSSSIELNLGGSEVIKNTTFGPIGLNFELGMHKYLGLSIGAAYGTNTHTISLISNDDGKIKLNYYNIEASVRGHYPKVKKIDPYIGLGLSYSKIKFKFSEEVTSSSISISTSSPSILFASIGVRFHFETNFSGYLEFKSGTSPVAVGVCLKI